MPSPVRRAARAVTRECCRAHHSSSSGHTDGSSDAGMRADGPAAKFDADPPNPCGYACYQSLPRGEQYKGIELEQPPRFSLRWCPGDSCDSWWIMEKGLARADGRTPHMRVDRGAGRRRAAATELRPDDAQSTTVKEVGYLFDDAPAQRRARLLTTLNSPPPATRTSCLSPTSPSRIEVHRSESRPGPGQSRTPAHRKGVRGLPVPRSAGLPAGVDAGRGRAHRGRPRAALLVTCAPSRPAETRRRATDHLHATPKPQLCTPA